MTARTVKATATNLGHKVAGVVARPSKAVLWTKDTDGFWRKYKVDYDNGVVRKDWVHFNFDGGQPKAVDPLDVGKRVGDPTRVGGSCVLKPVPFDNDVDNLQGHLDNGPSAEYQAFHIDWAALPQEKERKMAEKTTKKSIGKAIASAAGSSVKKAIPATISRRSINAGRKYLAATLQETHPQIAAAIESPAGQAAAAFLMPLIGVAVCSQFEDNPTMLQAGEMFQAALDVGAVDATDVVMEKFAMPLMAVMLQAGGFGGAIPANTDTPEESKVPAKEEE